MKITLTNGEERNLAITTRALYRFEKRGGRLSDLQSQPISTMVDLTIAAIAKKGEDEDALVDLLPGPKDLTDAITVAMQESGMGEPKAIEHNG